MLVWAPSLNIQNTECKMMDEFIAIAHKKYGFSADQALGILFWHEHDLTRAMEDLDNFTPFPDEWSVEDKVIFEQAFQFHGKSFGKIRQMMPDKKMPQVIEYYYKWDKIRESIHCTDKNLEHVDRDQTSLMDFQERKLKTIRDEGGYGEENYPHGSDDEKEEPPSSQTKCLNGVKRSSNKPKGMHINHDDLLALASVPPGQGDHQLLKTLDIEIVTCKRTVRNNKQLLSALRSNILKDDCERPIGPYRIPDPTTRINVHWSNEELLLAVQGVKKFGKNFKTIAEVLGTKTESHVRSFFVNYRKRYNLDNAYKEYEAEYGPTNDDDDIQIKMEKEGSETPLPGCKGRMEEEEGSEKHLPGSSRSKSPVTKVKITPSTTNQVKEKLPLQHVNID